MFTSFFRSLLQRLEVHFDYENKRFRAEFRHTKRTAIRRYDQVNILLIIHQDETIGNVLTLASGLVLRDRHGEYSMSLVLLMMRRAC